MTRPSFHIEIVTRVLQRTFSDLLGSYTTRTKSNHWEEIPRERLLKVLERYHPEVSCDVARSHWCVSGFLVSADGGLRHATLTKRLSRSLGRVMVSVQVISRCGHDPVRPVEETLSSLRDMLEWFRQVH